MRKNKEKGSDFASFLNLLKAKPSMAKIASVVNKNLTGDTTHLDFSTFFRNFGNEGVNILHVASATTIESYKGKKSTPLKISDIAVFNPCSAASTFEERESQN